MMKWIYLPEVPDNGREVFVADRNEENVTKGSYSLGEWYNANGHLLWIQDSIYAWAELPEKPPTKEELEKEAWLKERHLLTCWDKDK